MGMVIELQKRVKRWMKLGDHHPRDKSLAPPTKSFPLMKKTVETIKQITDGLFKTDLANLLWSRAAIFLIQVSL
jgi:hypothetical protein